MSSRGERMVELVCGKETGAIKKETKISSNEKLKMSKPKNVMECDKANITAHQSPNRIKIASLNTIEYNATIHDRYFQPVVQNETCGSFLKELNFWNEKPTIISDVLVQEAPSTSKLVHEFTTPEWENSDDSIKDPDYQKNDSDISSIEDELDTNYEMEKLGKQVEESLLKSPEKILVSKRAENKKKRNSGKSYKTKTGRLVSERNCEPLDLCKKKCKDKISFEEQKMLFNQYWSLGTYNQRLLYLAGFIDIVDKKTQKLQKNLNNSRNRKYTYVYSVQKNQSKIVICQKCFRKCFGETESFLKSIIAKKLASPQSEFSDGRGKSTPNKFDVQTIDAVKNHINCFPAYESHYCRRDTSKKYLSADLTLGAMHRLYLEKHPKGVSLTKYSEIFKSMNLKFKAPQLDTCSTCDKLHMKIVSLVNNVLDQNVEKEKLEKHQKVADTAYEMKKLDKLRAQDKKLKAYCFDLQQCLPTPLLKSSMCFYKRQLWTYNLTMHVLANNDPTCYMWHEGVARRGGNEIASSVYKHLLSEDKEVCELTFYSDSCPGQNKNSFVSTMFIKFLVNSEKIEFINHKFLEPGHTRMECDADHSIIERKKKRTTQQIYHPRDWYQLVRSNIRFTCTEMKKEDFYDFAFISKNKFVWKKVNEDGEKFSWLPIRWLRYKKSEFGIVEYKNSLDEAEPFKRLNIRKRGVNSLTEQDLVVISEPVLITKEKKKDLIELCQFIDPDFHEFYKSLPTTMDDVPNVHPDLIDEDEIQQD